MKIMYKDSMFIIKKTKTQFKKKKKTKNTTTQICVFPKNIW